MLWVFNVKNVVCPPNWHLQVNKVHVFTCCVDILINKWLAEPVYICFVNKDQHQEEWTGRGTENFNSTLPFKKNMFSSVSGRAGSAHPAQSCSIFVQELCFVVIAWIELPHKRAIGWSGVCSEKGGQCFLTLCSVGFNAENFTLELEKRVYIHGLDTM